MVTAPRCVIVGAGLSGLTAANTLQARGWQVVVLDKGRAPGGRMATRRIGESHFDHGAQFLTARDPRFRKAVEEWEASGWIVPWFTENGQIRFRAKDGMNALAKRLASSLDVCGGTKVLHAEASAEGWRVITEGGERFSADALLLTAPGEQSQQILAYETSRLPPVEFDPCFALLIVLEGRSRVPEPGYVRPGAGPIEWIGDNTQKGVSTGCGAALTIHARAEFSREHFDEDHEQVARLLLSAAEPWCQTPVITWQLHRWKYSKAINVSGPTCHLLRDRAPLVVAGDGFGGGRLEGAYLSGLEAAERIAAA